MSKISLTPNASGTGNFTIASPNSNTDRTLTLPDSTGTVVVTSGAQTIEFADGSASAPSITNSGDTNTGMFFPAADTIAFAEGGAEAMRLDASGNVGIGNTAPNTRLHVQGGTNADGSLTYNQQLTSTAAFNASPTTGTLVSLQYNSGGSYAGMGGWSVNKENATDGNFASYLALHTRPNGGSTTEQMRITSAGLLQFNSGYGSVATAYGCRAWVKFSGSTGSINGSGNVSSVSDNGTGNFTVNFSTAMPDANYAWNGTCDPTSAQTSDSAVKVVFGKPDTNPTTSAIALLTASSGAGRDDMESVFVTVFR